MQIAYYRFVDDYGLTLRYGVSEEGEEPQIVEDAFIDDLGKWLKFKDVSRYVFLEPGEIEQISVAEATKRTNGRLLDETDGEIPTKPPVFSGPYVD